MVYKAFKKAFINFHNPIDFNLFCECIEKLLNCSYEFYKKMYFKLLDTNNDDKICDSDLFRLMMLMKDNKIFELLKTDLCKITK